MQLTRDIFQPILFGGDQLTAARARGCQRHRVNSETATNRLQGLIPVSEDWHASVVLLGVSMLYCVVSIIICIHADYNNIYTHYCVVCISMQDTIIIILIIIILRSYSSVCTTQPLQLTMVHFTSYVI